MSDSRRLSPSVSTMQAAEPATWLSAHLFFDGALYGWDADTVILRLIAPFVARCRAERWIDRYFFVRYADTGSHLRLRLLVPMDHPRTVAGELLSHVSEYAPAADLEPYDAREAFSPVVRTTAQQSVTSRGTQSIVAVRWIPYEPETERYGGARGVEIAEEAFEASSDAAIALLSTLGQQRPLRLGRALAVMIAHWHVFHSQRSWAATAAEDYGSGYLRTMGVAEPTWRDMFAGGMERQAASLTTIVNATWDALSSGAAPAPLNDLSVQLARVHDHLRAASSQGDVILDGTSRPNIQTCVSRIVPSYVHMANNRLGVSVPEEAYLAHLVGWTLGKQSPAMVNAPGPP